MHLTDHLAGKTIYSVIRFGTLKLVTTVRIPAYGCECMTRKIEASSTIQNFDSFSRFKIGYEPLK
jgi:hypothetical protein